MLFRSCSGASPKVSDLTATGTSILWYSASSGGSSLSTSLSLSDGNYYASQTVSGCESTSRFGVSVTVNPDPSITITGDTTYYDKVSLTASGGTSYSWSGGQNKSSASNIFYNTGYYKISVTDANNCSANKVVFVQIKIIGVSSKGIITEDSTIQIGRAHV